MNDERPSATAMHVALRRAAHQLFDRPCVFEDPLALTILGTDAAANLAADAASHEAPVSKALRAFLAARSRYAEDAARAAFSRGVAQYVLLGAGLDTFAYREGRPRAVVFEVDHPSTQGWKRERLNESKISVPPSLRFAPVDFEKETLAEGLGRAGFDFAAPAFFSWLGVTVYLTRGAIDGTLRSVAGGPKGTEIVFDFSRPPASLPAAHRAAFDAVASRSASLGEPWITFFEPDEISGLARGLGFERADVVSPDSINELYFQGREDRLRVGPSGHLLHARV